MDWVASFTALPVWAQVLAIITFAASAGVFVVVTKLGIAAGRNGSAQQPEAKAQVAAMIVDPTAINAAAAEVAGLSVAITESNVTARSHAAATDRLADRIGQLIDGIDDLRTEVIRSSAKLK